MRRYYRIYNNIRLYAVCCFTPLHFSIADLYIIIWLRQIIEYKKEIY